MPDKESSLPSKSKKIDKAENSTLAVKSRLDVSDERMRTTLESWDRIRNGKVNLKEIWSEQKVLGDPNIMVLDDFYKMRTLLQTIYDDYFENRGRREKEMQNDIESDTPESTARYLAAIEKYSEEQARHIQQLTNLAKLIQTFAREYRECVTSRRSNIHITEVEALCQAFKAVLHEHISDSDQLAKITESLSDIFSRTLPLSLTSEIY